MPYFQYFYIDRLVEYLSNLSWDVPDGCWTAYCSLFFSSRVVINADAPYIKMVSEQFDRCHGTLLQYVEFLCSAVTPPSAYAQLIPSLDDLVHMYHLDPEVSPPPSLCVCVLHELINFM